MVFSFSVILSLPFICPDCWTCTACSVADAPRGMTMDPPTITGSSTIALNRWPACDTSTSMSCASRTFSGVPAGTVTAGRGAGAAAAVAARRGWRRRWRRLPGRELHRDGVRERDLGDAAVVEQHPHGLAVAADEHALDDLAGSQADAVGVQRHAGGGHEERGGYRCVESSSRSFPVGRDRERGRDLQVDEQLQLVLDLEKAQRRARRQRGLHPLVALGLRRVPPGFEVERLGGEAGGALVGERRRRRRRSRGSARRARRRASTSRGRTRGRWARTRRPPPR